MAASSLIPGTNRFADLPKDVMNQTSVFVVRNEFFIRPRYEKRQIFDSIFGKFVDIIGEVNGYEVVYPNGKICSHVFESEKAARAFVEEVKNRI